MGVTRPLLCVFTAGLQYVDKEALGGYGIQWRQNVEIKQKIKYCQLVKVLKMQHEIKGEQKHEL